MDNGKYAIATDDARIRAIAEILRKEDFFMPEGKERRMAMDAIDVMESIGVIAHSEDLSWAFNGKDLAFVEDAIVGRLKIEAFRLWHSGWKQSPFEIHTWCRGGTWAACLAEHESDRITIHIAVSFTSSTGQHMQLVSRSARLVASLESLVADGMAIAGFPSYDSHCLFAFLALSGLDDEIGKDGRIRSDRPSEYQDMDGAEAFACDESGMAILESLYGY